MHGFFQIENFVLKIKDTLEKEDTNQEIEDCKKNSINKPLPFSFEKN